jgi:hypothetical protein
MCIRVNFYQLNATHLTIKNNNNYNAQYGIYIYSKFNKKGLACHPFISWGFQGTLFMCEIYYLFLFTYNHRISRSDVTSGEEGFGKVTYAPEEVS